MSLSTKTEHDQLRDAVRRWVAITCPSDAVRAAEGTAAAPYDRASWVRGCREIGLSGLLAPSEIGGAETGLAEVAVAIEELAAGLSGAPLLSTVLAMDAMLLAEDAPWHTLGVNLLEGNAIIGFDLGTHHADIVLSDGGATGMLSTVLDGPGATMIVALTDAGLIIVPADARGVDITQIDGLDLTRRTACVRLTNAPYDFHPLPADGLQRLADHRRVLLAADALGLMRGALAMVADYAKIRVAFGRLMGSFQGVKHQLADIYCTVELCEAVVRAAIAEQDEHGPDGHKLALVAQRLVIPSAVRVTTECLRLLGGIGYTWEHDAHLYVRRAHANVALAGPQGVARDQLADILELKCQNLTEK
ncbi:hypothetical protein B2J88_33015 [Rhodococcus sp. SRB_17]|uniref:acyl-CoA dehydrogenase family protein n=1 Tax=Rhodococcus sp. OK302 TaxID=1882769 RepID=UPI000B942A00|nr:acyl-CoA dehydrogenase family protein [Rhodococcus sp. OK302]NMM89112.1 hypothetical protein [Rhodococcus sp. SRB_17]OYD66950.1 alkylation response protein AidB-like acyl-CoA dehydrogenase [Rhodococcus sp. OK302]